MLLAATIGAMNDIITVRGIVATEPRHLVTEAGLEITSLRVASQSRKWDRAASSWANGETNWFTVTAFRTLAANVHESVGKGDRVVIAGRLRIRNWEREDRSGISVEIEADAVGHDLAWGRSSWTRTPRAVGDEQAGAEAEPDAPHGAPGLEDATTEPGRMPDTSGSRDAALSAGAVPIPVGDDAGAIPTPF